MSLEVEKMSARSRTPVAERMRLYRKRRRRGVRCVRVQLHVTEIDTLIRKGYLDRKSRDDCDAVDAALGAFVDDALANEALHVTSADKRLW
jgi:hypothetical protein